MLRLSGRGRHRVDADQVFPLHPEHDERDDQGEQGDPSRYDEAAGETVGERVVCHRGRRVPRRRGAVLPDVNADDVKALMTSCLTRTPTQADPKARDRMVAIATRGIRTP